MCCRSGDERARVAFVHHATAVQHEDAVGVVGVERGGPGHRLGAADRHEGDRVEIGPLGARQRRHRAAPARDRHRGHQLAHVRERPSRLRELVVAAVGEADDFRRGRRRSRPSSPSSSDRWRARRAGPAPDSARAQRRARRSRRRSRRAYGYACGLSRGWQLGRRPATSSSRNGARSGSTHRGASLGREQALARVEREEHIPLGERAGPQRARHSASGRPGGHASRNAASNVTYAAVMVS